jgi:hypothetical protein
MAAGKRGDVRPLPNGWTPGSYNNIGSDGVFFGFGGYQGHQFFSIALFWRFYSNEIQIGRFKTIIPSAVQFLHARSP